LATALPKIDYSAFEGCSGLTSLTIPNSVTKINLWAFAYCSGLTSVTIGSGINDIGERTFLGCSGLTQVNIPSSITYIGYGAFTGCSGLTSINVDTASTYFTSEDGVLFSKYMGMLLMYPEGKQGGYTIPSSVTRVDSWTFAYCSALTSVSIPSGVTDIGEYAFTHCSGLTSITNLRTEPQTIDDDMFYGVDKSACTLYVPKASVKKYREAEGWKKFENIEPLPE
jgi:hypothetical protein